MNEIDKLYEKMMRDIEKEIVPIIVDEMKNIEQEVIEEVVYNQYTNTYYERRFEDGGLSDKENMKETIIKSGDNIEIRVENITKGNPNYSKAEGYTDEYIADIIETGQGYGYGLDDLIGERPFTEISQNVIDYTDRIPKLFENEMKKRGWK